MDVVADEPGRAGNVEVEKVGGEAVEADTGAKARSGSERETSREGVGSGRGRGSALVVTAAGWLTVG